MIEWIQHWDEMRFYYWSGLSWLVLLPVYAGGLLALGILGWVLTKTWKHAWILIIPLLPVFAIWPWWEELHIAWNFGQLCKKDAGIFIYKTVEVDGFYDDTTHWWRQLAESDYQFVESRERGPNVVWRVERDGNELKHFKIDRPTARYQYHWPDFNRDVAHEIKRSSQEVVDTQTGEILGGSVRNGREAPWFFVSLDRPGMGCDRPVDGATGKHKTSFLIYRDILIPIKR